MSDGTMAVPDPIDAEFDALLAPQNAAPATVAPADVDAEFDALAKPPPEAPPEPFSWTKFLKEQGNEAARTAANVAWAGPGMAMDLGVGVRNLIAGKNPNGQYPYEMPSTTFHRALDSVTTPPTSTAGKWGEGLASLIGGSFMPGPSQLGTLKSAITGSPLPAGVPANFIPPVSQAQQNLADVRNAGYVIPPSTVNPTMTNRVIESIGGKTGTQQDASVKNMEVTDSLVRKALGMAPDAEITPQALKTIRAEAGTAKTNLIAQAGDVVKLDPAHSQGIDQILAPYRQAGQELDDSFGNPALVKAGEAIDKEQITPKVAMTAIGRLRDQAKMAFRQGDDTTGVAYKGLATNLEKAIDRHLDALGKSDVVDSYRAARELQAKTYDVEDALNEATGHVNANILKRADYLSGDLATAAQAAKIAPKATREILDSGSVRNTDIMTGGFASLMEKDPKFLLYPYARQLVRKGMLSNVGQNAMLGPTRGLFSPPAAPPSVSGFPQSLFGQLNLQNQ